ncbi:MAG: 50S ribosomal protein L17 [PVC group bacterium]|nr:50S ribosomal protein L17 [PVC group bacterium]
MRHRKNIKRLSRQSAHRKAVLINQVKSLLEKEQIKTTVTLAKESRRLAAKLITMGKNDTVASRRQAFKVLGDRDLVKLLFSDIALRFSKRAGGYTRIVRLGTRKGDNAQLVILELTELKPEEKKEKKQTKAKKEVTAKTKKSKTKKEQVEEAQLVEEQEPEEGAEGDKKGFLGGLRKFLKKEDRVE